MSTSLPDRASVEARLATAESSLGHLRRALANLEQRNEPLPATLNDLLADSDHIMEHAAEIERLTAA